MKSKLVLLSGMFQSFVSNNREKFKNLYQTNYKTGMYHLEHGNLWDATLRFKIIKKFWPEKLEAQYQYAICLILQNMIRDAKALLSDVLKNNPDYTEAKTLLEDIESNKTQQIIEEYKAKFEKDNETEKK
ncbi:MAG TPA: tetratricopeptide repeat protein [Rickettsiales bacterium]|nr:tetratricopeptide repeat protein [Rickettsiales bacterium]